MFREVQNERKDQRVCASCAAWLSCAPMSPEGWSSAHLGLPKPLARPTNKIRPENATETLTTLGGEGFSTLFSWTHGQLCHSEILQRGDSQTLKAESSTTPCSSKNYPNLTFYFLLLSNLRPVQLILSEGPLTRSCAKAGEVPLIQPYGRGGNSKMQDTWCLPLVCSQSGAEQGVP